VIDQRAGIARDREPTVADKRSERSRLRDACDFRRVARPVEPVRGLRGDRQIRRCRRERRLLCGLAAVVDVVARFGGRELRLCRIGRGDVREVASERDRQLAIAAAGIPGERMVRRARDEQLDERLGTLEK
jgi:hypothetical protein